MGPDPQLSTGQDCQLLHGPLLASEASAGGQPSRPPPLGAPLCCQLDLGPPPLQKLWGGGGSSGDLGSRPGSATCQLHPASLVPSAGPRGQDDLRGTSGSQCPGPDPLALGFPLPSPVPAARQSYRIRHHKVPKPRSLCQLPLLKRLTQKDGF